jgi:hypothetical protein
VVKEGDFDDVGGAAAVMGRGSSLGGRRRGDGAPA